jgi:hypothetical protein
VVRAKTPVVVARLLSSFEALVVACCESWSLRRRASTTFRACIKSATDPRAPGAGCLPWDEQL